MLKLRHLLTAVAALIIVPSVAWAAPDWAAVGQALGKTGAVMAGGVYRVGLPRTDLHVQLGDIELKPTFALGSWVAFAPMGDQTMVMGDLVLTEDEVEPVMKSLLDSGLEVTALHNHLFNARPATFYMHVGGMGDPVKLASSIHTALAMSKTPFTAAPAPTTPPAIDLDTAAIDAALGAKGAIAGGVYQVGVPRSAPAKAMGMEVGGPLGGAVHRLLGAGLAVRASSCSLQGVGQRQGQHPPHLIVVTGCDQTVDPFRAQQATGRVVHQHPIMRLGTARQQLVQAVGHTLGPAGAPHARHPGPIAGEAGGVLLEGGIAGRQDHQGGRQPERV